MREVETMEETKAEFTNTASLDANATAQKKPRMVEQDIAKGIAMLLVILCHTMPTSYTVDCIVRACGGYIMTFFFFISGYHYKTGRNIPYWERLGRKAKQILAPLLRYSLIVCVIIGIAAFLSGGLPHTVSILKAYVGMWLSTPVATWLGLPTIGTFEGYERAFEPYWFLFHMLTAYVIYYAVVEYAFRDRFRFISVNVLLVLITTVLYWQNILLPWGFHNAFALASIMMLGTLFGRYRLLNQHSAPGSCWNWINPLVSFVIVFSLGMLFPRAGHISGSGQMAKVLGPVEVPYTVLFSMVCSYFLVSFSKLVAKVPVVSTFLAWFGRRSMIILLIHLIFVYASKMILGADLNTGLGFVDYFDWKNGLAVILTVVLTSGYLLLAERLAQKKQPQAKAA